MAQLSWNVANGLYEFKRHGGFRESLPRRIADVFLPKGTARREFVKKIIPKGSLPWRISKKIYYLFANH